MTSFAPADDASTLGAASCMSLSWYWSIGVVGLSVFDAESEVDDGVGDVVEAGVAGAGVGA
jgi:hypothetical protein